jgi:SAM-dependent methyltransferase
MGEKGVILFRENVYGHAKRLRWILSHVQPGERILELGCGTGSMISLPLACLGYQVVGIDTDSQSIAFGKELCRKMNLDPNLLATVPFSQTDLHPNVIIASEVFEHLCSEELSALLSEIRSKLKRGGLLLVTVPNGYGCFEFESLLWFKVGVGRLVEQFRIDLIIRKIKTLLFGRSLEDPYHFIPSTLSVGSHIQRFTLTSILNILKSYEFKVVEVTGSSLISGPISNLLFTGIEPLMKINCSLGAWFPRISSNFYLSCSPFDS